MSEVRPEEVVFPSASGACAAWWYAPPPSPAGLGAPAVVMGNGFSMTRHDGLRSYAEVFATAGVGVLVFDYRHFGDSPGQPRQRFRVRLQLEDWTAAIAYARSRAVTARERVALWGFSFGAGHAIEIAARDRSIAALVLLCPFLDGPARVSRTPPGVARWVFPRALADLCGRHNLIPVAAYPGTRAAMSQPGEAEGLAKVVPPSSTWRNEVSPGILITALTYRPVRHARRIVCPAWIGMGNFDISAPARAVERFARRAPRAELHRHDFDHFGALAEEAARRLAREQLAFMQREAGPLGSG